MPYANNYVVEIETEIRVYKELYEKEKEENIKLKIKIHELEKQISKV